jgi:Protein of unknown function (DUF4231)
MVQTNSDPQLNVDSQQQPDTYPEFLKKDFNQLFDTMGLDARQTQFMRSRWLDQVLWMEKRAAHCRDRHYQLRLTAIVLGVLVPVLVGIDPGWNLMSRRVFKGLTIALSSVVAVSTAVEEFFHYGDRWYHYRRTVESLKAQGWQFSQLCGSYRSYKSHNEAFTIFADQIEEIIARDVEVYVTQIAKSEDQQNQQT